MVHLPTPPRSFLLDFLRYCTDKSTFFYSLTEYGILSKFGKTWKIQRAGFFFYFLLPTINLFIHFFSNFTLGKLDNSNNNNCSNRGKRRPDGSRSEFSSRRIFVTYTRATLAPPPIRVSSRERNNVSKEKGFRMIPRTFSWESERDFHPYDAYNISPTFLYHPAFPFSSRDSLLGAVFFFFFLFLLQSPNFSFFPR